jgi:hypothetical protein
MMGQVTVYTKTKDNPTWMPQQTYANSRLANEACGKMKAQAEADGKILYCKMERK